MPRSSTVVAVLLALGAVLLFYLLRNVLEDAIRWKSSHLIPISIGSLVGAFLFAAVRYDTLPSLFRILTRTTALGVLVSLACEPPDFTLAEPAHSRTATFVDWGHWVALALSAASLWRPSFLFPAATYSIATRYVVEDISGFTLSTLDVRYMVEMAQFLALSACGLAVIRAAVRVFGERPVFRLLSRVDLQLLAICLAYIAIGFHLGNYFWSGIAKVFLGPYPWSWAFENQTQNMMLGALKRSVLPSGALPGLTQGLFDGLGYMVVLSNAFVLLTQLFALMAVFRVSWLRLSTLAYDALHIGIFIFGGLFFWPWIWNNVSILLALRRESDSHVAWAPKLCCFVVVLLGGSIALGASARLAWWDVADFKIPMVQAQVAGGDWVDVPVSYYLSHSYAISHGYIDGARTQGHYVPSLWGSIADWVPDAYERQRTSGTCPEPPYIEDVETPAERQERLERVDRFMRAHHEKMVLKAGETGHYNFYLRSHHHPSNPWMHGPFNDLDIREIDRYRVLTQSVCLSMVNGRLVERVIKEDSVLVGTDG